MNTFDTLDKILGFITEKMAWVAMIAILVCAALVVSDVARYNLFHKPIPGSHELVELIAAVILSMSVAYVTHVKGHVAVGIRWTSFGPGHRLSLNFLIASLLYFL